ncbi:MAG: efflux RND transporter permease subunit [Clostridiales bacterium]|nr:efflux RND transporter permease subunit [Clostridiales bacterium]
MNLTKTALKRPVSTMLVVLALIVFGITSVFSFRLELTPDMEMPMLLVITVYPGADPESVEELVTKEIEAAGSEQSGVESYESMSVENMSQVMFQYDYEMDIDDAYMDLRTALDVVTATLPDDCEEPFIIEISMDAMDTMTLSATAVGDVDLLGYVEDTLVPELETLTGVADVNVTGGKENYIKVVLDPEAMKQYGLSMNTIAQSIGALDFMVPAGSVSQGTQDVAVSSSADLSGVVQIQNIPITTAKGSVIPLSEIATVSESQKDAQGISRYDGQENISIGISKKQSAGTVNVTRDVEKVLDELQQQNDAVELEVIYNASDMILSSLGSVGSAMVSAVLLSMVVLFLFFGDLKASFVVGSSMPISLFATMVCMNMAGFSFNVVTMGALVIAIGMMVDSSIVVLESCFRLKETNGNYKTAAEKGTGVVAASIVASTITTVVVYLPLSVMKGLSGQMFSQLGFTIIFAMLASLVAALTLIPLLFSKFKPVEKKELPINKLLNKINHGYDKLLRKLLYKKKTVLVVAVLLLVGAFGLATQLHSELMPSMDEGAMAITATFRSGTKLETIDEQTRFIEEMTMADPNLERCNMQISEDKATLTAYLTDECKLSTNEVIEQYTEKLADVTNMKISIAASGASMTSMMGGGVEIDLSGRNLDDLKTAAREVEKMMWQVPGVLQVSSDVGVASTKAEIIVDPLKSMNVGLASAQVAGELYNALSGKEAATLTREGEEYSIRLEYPEGQYETMNDLMNMTLTTPRGTQVPVSELAEVVYTDAPVTLYRVEGIYQIAITASTTESARFEAQDAINKAVDEMEFPKGVARAQSSMDEMMMEEFTAIVQAIAVAIFLIFLVMAMQFESPRFSVMVMLSIPFALIGSFGLLFITGSTISMTSLMGILMLVGIVVNNGILYVDTANQLRQEMFMEDALIQSGQIRLRPILMTTLTTILSMIPMGLGIGEGSVMMQGMALIIIGGLIASTLLILLLMPTFYLIIYEGRGKRLKRKQARKIARMKAEEDRKKLEEAGKKK